MVDILWFLPTHGDGRWLGTSNGGRQLSLGYARQVAEAADQLGYYGVLLPTGRSCEDSWVVASSLIAATRQLRFLVAFRPGLQSPSVAARMAATFDRLSDGRLLVNIVTGGDPVELDGDGLSLGHAERYQVTDEFLTVWRRLLANETVDFAGDHIRVKGAKLFFPAIQAPHPPLYFGGSSDAGQDVAGKHVDVYLTWGEPPGEVAKKIAKARASAAAFGRTLQFGIRLHVIVRETEEAAWAAADDLIRYVTPEQVAQSRATFARFDSVGQQRMSALHAGRTGFDRASLEISPNLWAGVGLVRGGAGTALVGAPETVAARMKNYIDLGIDRFILSGYPHLEEAYRFAELVFPLLPRQRAEASLRSPTLSGPFGEIIANTALPDAPPQGTRWSGNAR